MLRSLLTLRISTEIVHSEDNELTNDIFLCANGF